MWLPKWQIAVEVDGRQHFEGAMHGKQATAQQRQDRKVDAKCRKQGLRLLRFHYADVQQWGRLIQRAVQQVEENPHCHFVRGTSSYAYEGILTL
jgi:very-short-patch-repair endonuclease